MQIRHFQPGDETVQAEIFNAAAADLPAFKPASADEIRRRYQGPDSDPSARFYAVKDGRVVGYAAFNPNGRISFPWCLPDATDVRGALLETMLDAMRQRGFAEAWAAYRADWRDVIDELKEHGFSLTREMINYVAELDSLPITPPPSGCQITPVAREDLTRMPSAASAVFAAENPDVLGRFFWENAYFESRALFGLTDSNGELHGLGLTIANSAYADATKLDASMPCFRLGAFGTETERHKRVNGMLSVAFDAEPHGEVLLAEAARRLRQAGRLHAAAQAPSDQPALCHFYERWFRRQGAFPILSRRLT